MKIEIKNRYTGEVIFEHTAEPNNFKLTVEAAGDVGASLSMADLRGAYLVGADLRNIDFQEADLSGSDLFLANLVGADMRDTCLRNAYMHMANLSGADLSGADLSGAWLPHGWEKSDDFDYHKRPWFLVLVGFVLFGLGYITADDNRIERERQAQQAEPAPVCQFTKEMRRYDDVIAGKRTH